MFKKNSLLMLLLALVISAAINSPVNADGPPSKTEPNKPVTNETTIIQPDIGPDDSRGEVGQNGYKVFNPGAIKTIIVSPEATVSPENRSVLASITRTGSTDAWLSWSWSWDWKEWGWDHHGSHTSSSTTWEDTIWVDGYLKVTIDPSWRKTCSNHTSGNYAFCGTEFFQLLPRTIDAQSNHYFYSDGYGSSYFTTADSA